MRCPVVLERIDVWSFLRFLIYVVQECAWLSCASAMVFPCIYTPFVRFEVVFKTFFGCVMLLVLVEHVILDSSLNSDDYLLAMTLR